eukprot:365948-Chlamydomonas_euryale.AAC.6
MVEANATGRLTQPLAEGDSQHEFQWTRHKTMEGQVLPMSVCVFRVFLSAELLLSLARSQLVSCSAGLNERPMAGN